MANEGNKTHIENAIAMAMTPGMSCEQWRVLEDNGIPVDNYIASTPELFSNIAHTFSMDEVVFKARKEAEYVQQHNIRAIHISDDSYPWRLRETPDAPLVLYVLGSLDLNSVDMLSVVGTRRCSAYGTNFCDTLIDEIASGYEAHPGIVSGLAYGIDSAAHNAALRNEFPTAAVLAHGLQMIYPAQNRSLAAEIVAKGGALITEYPSGTTPFPKRFLERNRIVAGMAAATIVVESEVKGGAMSTANFAFNYNRDLFAVPGRINDTLSAGCNQLIRTNKASLIMSATDLADTFGWRERTSVSAANPPSLFTELEGDSRRVYEYLRKKASHAAADEMHAALAIAMPQIMAILAELEFDGIIHRLPGNRYQLI